MGDLQKGSGSGIAEIIDVELLIGASFTDKCIRGFVQTNRKVVEYIPPGGDTRVIPKFHIVSCRVCLRRRVSEWVGKPEVFSLSSSPSYLGRTIHSSLN